MVGLRKKRFADRTRGIQPRITPKNVDAIKGEDQIQASFLDVLNTNLNTRKRVMQARRVDTISGQPAHGQFNAALDGQYLNVVSKGRDVGGKVIVTKVPHDLGRAPQGIIWIRQPTSPSTLIVNAEVRGLLSGGLKISDKNNAYFLMVGPKGEQAIALLF